MFKSVLIENQRFYSKRRTELLLFLLTSLLIGGLVNFFNWPTWIAVTYLGVVILMYIVMIKNQRSMTLMREKTIELDESEIRIKTKNGNLLETIDLGKVDKLEIKENFVIPMEQWGSLLNELKGNGDKTYLNIIENKNQRRIDFEIDSHYKLNLFMKVIDQWKERNYNIDLI